MNYGAIKSYDIANGPGVRVSLFVSGCEHFCKGCFNSEAWSFSYGDKYTENVNEELFNNINHIYIRGLTILGGEPMHPKNQSQILEIVKEFRYRYKYVNKDIWLYTGYLYEDLIQGKIGEYSIDILNNIDVLVDGPFKNELKDIGLNFRGSKNQRIIDVKKSIFNNDIILHPLGIGDLDKYSKRSESNE